jgi:hypothetical protein
MIDWLIVYGFTSLSKIFHLLFKGSKIWVLLKRGTENGTERETEWKTERKTEWNWINIQAVWECTPFIIFPNPACVMVYGIYALEANPPPPIKI